MSDTVASPTFSVITPAYQAASTLSRAIASVQAQTLPDWEMVIVDDGSTDRTGLIAEDASKGDPRIRVVRQDNAGSGEARNTALALAKASWVCLLDSDDVLDPTYMRSQLDLMSAHPGHSVYCCNATVVTETGARYLWRAEARFAEVGEITMADMVVENLVFVMAVADREAVLEVGGFRPILAEDYDLWLRLLASGRSILFNPAVLGEYTVLSTSQSAQASRVWDASAEVLKALLAADDDLDPAVRRTAGRSQRRFEGAALLGRLLEGEVPADRRGAIAAAAGYSKPHRRWAARILAFLSPKAFVRILGGRRERVLEERYAASGPEASRDESPA